MAGGSLTSDLNENMVESINPVEIIRAALMERDPRILEGLTQSLSNWEGMLKVREQLQDLVIDPDDYEPVFSWLWHDDPTVAERVRTLVLLLHDTRLDIDIFTRLEKARPSEIPFNIDYDVAEREFRIALPGVPGWGVSHWSENPDIDRLLLSLERVYAAGNEGHIPPFFRR